MISFIIPAYNEEQLLGRTLEAIHKAAKEIDAPYELIAVDDNSSDNTGKTAEDLGATVVKVNHRQISATRFRSRSGQKPGRSALYCSHGS
jgi:glycosyltransferase involved in cell wall biosynthesis